jgi:uncharacterized lipoprotein YddW (UPF0748 family)
MQLLTRLGRKSILITVLVLLICTGVILALIRYLPFNQGGTQEFRGAWIATVENIDWPSRSGLSASVQQQEFVHLLDTVQQMNMNAVIVQIKPEADAFYPSSSSPWSAYLTGTQGKNPGYDPLSFMVAEAHKRHIEFHGWFNPYRVSLHDDINALAPNHPARQHPDWIVSYGGRLYYNPGIPAAREFVVNSILEAVTGYDIDAVHMDDYFYPFPVAGKDFPDDATYQQYNAGHFKSLADWRRDNVNQLVHELSVKIKQAKAHVKFGISPFGVWRNKATDPTGSDTRATQSYDNLYADTRTWIRKNWLDYIAPQLYWSIGYPPAAYDKLVDWWSKEVTGQNVHLYIGQAAYMIGKNQPAAWTDPEEMPRHLQLDRHSPQVKGSIFFSLKDLRRNPLGFKDRLINDLYKQKAVVPRGFRRCQ